MSNIDLSRRDGESEFQFLFRLGEMKSNGIIDMTWSELAKVINAEFRDDDIEFSESAYRKRYAVMKRFNEECRPNALDDGDVDTLKSLKEEIQKEKRKLFDQRREYNKLLAYDARAEHLTDCMIAAANELNDNYPLLQCKDDIAVGHKEALVCFSDWHYGMTTDNIWNTYNTTICKERVAKCVKYMKQYLKLHKINTLHVALLGDAAHGAIHQTCRVKSEEDTCDQIMNVAEILAQAINELSMVVGNIVVYSCYGNHLRTVQKKDESVHSDNMEKLIPWWLEQRFQNHDDIVIKYSEYKEFTPINILGKTICAIHGDGFNFKDIAVTTNMIFTKQFNTTIDYTVSGDRHHLEEFGTYGIESILVRSLCGCDDWANDKRLYDKPGQTLIIFNDDYGRECTYHIPL